MVAGITVTLDFEQLFDGVDQDERPIAVVDRILDLAAHQLLQHLNRDEVLSRMRQRVGEIRDEVIREQLTPLVQDALTAAFQPTDAFGAPKGAPTTLREVIVKAGVEALTVPTADRNGYRTGKTLLQERIVAEVESALKADLTKELNTAKAEVGAAVREQGAAIIQQTIERMAVRS